MKKIIYGNIVSIIIFFVLPFSYSNLVSFEKRYFSAAALIYFMVIGAILLIYINLRSAIKLKGRERIASIIFIIPPAFVILYFILGYIAFSRYGILG